jgi:hypothetical protein
LLPPEPAVPLLLPLDAELLPSPLELELPELLPVEPVAPAVPLAVELEVPVVAPVLVDAPVVAPVLVDAPVVLPLPVLSERIVLSVVDPEEHAITQQPITTQSERERKRMARNLGKVRTDPLQPRNPRAFSDPMVAQVCQRLIFRS